MNYLAWMASMSCLYEVRYYYIYHQPVNKIKYKIFKYVSCMRVIGNLEFIGTQICYVNSKIELKLPNEILDHKT